VSPSSPNHRILIVDDNRDVHVDFRKILCPPRATARQLDALEAALFGEPAASPASQVSFTLDSAHQGQDALAMVQAALAAGTPYAMAFVDMRMPPGWDGVETISRLWAADPDLHVVICSAYSDYSWTEVIQKIGQSDGLLIMKKPFDAIEVVQAAHAFTAKWALHRRSRQQAFDLQSLVADRSSALERVEEKLRHATAEVARMRSALIAAERV